MTKVLSAVLLVIRHDDLGSMDDVAQKIAPHLKSQGFPRFKEVVENSVFFDTHTGESRKEEHRFPQFLNQEKTTVLNIHKNMTKVLTTDYRDINHFLPIVEPIFRILGDEQVISGGVMANHLGLKYYNLFMPNEQVHLRYEPQEHKIEGMGDTVTTHTTLRFAEGSGQIILTFARGETNELHQQLRGAPLEGLPPQNQQPCMKVFLDLDHYKPVDSKISTELLNDLRDMNQPIDRLFRSLTTEALRKELTSI